jgi:hypothetical protein
MSYFDFLDREGGFYFYRCNRHFFTNVDFLGGDALVRTLAIKLLLENQDIQYFDNIGYKHQGMCSLNCNVKGIECDNVVPQLGIHHNCKWGESYFR